MTKVDKYLNQYLEGSITELEMQEFRELLEAEPQLQTELRQILDLRSLVHDDLLSLNPPEFLSENVRELVGTQFAALAEEEEEKRRRAVFFTERIAGSFVTAMVALVLVALAPTLITRSGANDGKSISNIAALENATPLPAVKDVLVGTRSTSDNKRGTVSVPSRDETGRMLRDGTTRSGIGNRNASQESIDESGPMLAAVSNNPGATDPTGTVNRNATDGSTEDESLAVSTDNEAPYNSHIANLPPRLDLLIMRDGDNGLDRSVSLGINTNAETAKEEQGLQDNPDYVATTIPVLSSELESDDPSNPRIAFGFTVGAGALTSSSSSVALTQGAGYAAYSLNESNRIGIEAGGSKFRYVHTTYSQEIMPLGRRTASAADEWGTNASGGVAGVYQIYGSNGGGSRSGDGTIVPQSGPGSITDPPGEGGGDAKWGNAGQTLSSSVNMPSLPGVSATIRSHTYESDTSMGYGMLFYDRRLVSVNDELKIRSRVGVGGTDGGIILDLRAYAAFATNQNVAITLGVGGSALRELSEDGKFSANYGVQVGAELGF